MRSRKGFTLIELMVVVLIVAVLAAVLVPLISARIDAAKWSEAKAGIGNIASGLRAYWAEHQDEATDSTMTIPTREDVCLDTDLNGKYFLPPCYVVSAVTYDATGIGFTITVTASVGRVAAPTRPAVVTFTQNIDGTSVWGQSN